MDLNLLLLWNIALVTVFWFARSWKFVWPNERLWLAKGALVLAVCGVGGVVWPGAAGFVACAVWLPLFLLPSLAMARAHRCTAAGELGRAAAWSRVSAIAHPSAAWRAGSKLRTAQAHYQAGNVAAGHQVLERLAASAPAYRQVAPAYRACIDERFADAWELLESGQPPTKPADNFRLSLHLRVLDELGRHDEMLALHRAACQSTPALPYALRVHHDIRVAAATGQVETVEAMLEGPLAACSPESKRLWRAIVRRRAGETDTSELLSIARDAEDHAVAASAARRAQTPTEPFYPNADQAGHLAWIHSATVAAGASGSLFDRPRGRRPVATYLIAAALATVFAIQIPGGVENPFNLWQMGALVGPGELLADEYWRIVTANFLHFGWLHVAFNTLALWLFGRRLEHIIGSVRFLVCYLGSGFIGMSLFAGWQHLTAPGEAYMVVGASACVMGLVGALFAVLWRRYRREKRAATLRQLRMLALLVAFQTVLDLVIPQISAAAHLMGAGTGFVLATLVGRKPPEPSEAQR